MRKGGGAFLLLAASVVVGTSSAQAVNLDWVTVGAPGNAGDPDPNPNTRCGSARNEECGAVAYSYRIGTYEVTNAQYAEFLNAVAADDLNALYDPGMGSGTLTGGIDRSGSPGSYAYAVKTGFGPLPVVFVSFWDAVRFCNWLHNGQPVGAQTALTTEDGAYTLTPSAVASNTVARNPGAKVWLPNTHEWYKAAYYHPGQNVYFDYPAGFDTETVCDWPTFLPNRSNCGSVFLQLAPVGSYSGSASPSGTFDQGGNVWEWNEDIRSTTQRVYRGSAWNFFAIAQSASIALSTAPAATAGDFGFRVASQVLPTPDADADGVTDGTDNCPFAANADQADQGSIGAGSGPDGVGDACQCGDVNGDGRVTLSDAAAVQRSLLQPPTTILMKPTLCDVDANPGCTLSDAVGIRRALLNPPTAAIQQRCAPARP